MPLSVEAQPAIRDIVAQFLKSVAGHTEKFGMFLRRHLDFPWANALRLQIVHGEALLFQPFVVSNDNTSVQSMASPVLL
jgi:hypothetical protein